MKPFLTEEGHFRFMVVLPVGHEFDFNSQGISLYLATTRPKWVPENFFKYHAMSADEDTTRRVPGRYFIDERAVNTIILGDKRSGKGQTEVLPTIDLIARGEKDQSMVIGDMKGSWLH